MVSFFFADFVMFSFDVPDICSTEIFPLLNVAPDAAVCASDMLCHPLIYSVDEYILWYVPRPYARRFAILPLVRN